MQYSQKIKKNFFNLKIFFPTQWGKERVGQIERVALKHITLPHTKLGSQWKFAIYDAGSSNQEIWDNLEGRSGVEGRFKTEGTYVSVQFSHLVVSNSLQPHGLQYARPPCPAPTPGACSNSCPSSQWCHPTISSSVIFSSCLSIFPSISVFSNESVLHIRWPKYWSFSFSISPSNEYSGLISFMMDWLDLLPVQGTLKSFL